MPEVTSTLKSCGRSHNSGRKLPGGVHGMSELMAQVLARYGLEIVEDGDQEAIAVAASSVMPSYQLRPLQSFAPVSLQESLATC